MNERAHREIRFGWTSLLVWVLVGVSLETAHAFKWSAYLDDEVTRLLLTLAHAHGVGLSLVVLGYAATIRETRVAWPSRGLRLAALAIPAGFALGAIAHPEGDPSLGILLVPAGALVLVAALVQTVRDVWARPSRSDPPLD